MQRADFRRIGVTIPVLEVAFLLEFGQPAQ